MDLSHLEKKDTLEINLYIHEFSKYFHFRFENFGAQKTSLTVMLRNMILNLERKKRSLGWHGDLSHLEKRYILNQSLFSRVFRIFEGTIDLQSANLGFYLNWGKIRNHNMLMAVMTLSDCLKWPETPKPRPG